MGGIIKKGIIPAEEIIGSDIWKREESCERTVWNPGDSG